jgi:uncharacterized Zn-finger protein
MAYHCDLRTVNRAFSGARRKLPDLLMPPLETIYIDGMVAACNGGGGPLGHPRVYLNLAPAGRAECPYCSRLYVDRATAAAAEAPPSPAPAASPDMKEESP